MRIKIASNFHVFVPNGERDRKVAFTEGSVIGPGDMPPEQSMRDWIDKGLAVAVDPVGGRDDEAEGGAAV